MARDYIPRSDGNFNGWQNNFVTYAVVNELALGLIPAETASLSMAQTEWLAAYINNINAQNAARGAAVTKDDERDEFTTILRQLTKKIQARVETTNLQREALGITVPDLTRTPIPAELVLTTPSPIVEAHCTDAKTVRIDWYPSMAEGESEAIPQGLDGVAIYYAVYVEGVENQFKFLAMDTNSPYIHNVENDITKTLIYKARWFDKRKRMGPFGSEVKVAVTA